MRIYDDVTKLVGNTPLVRLNRLTEGAGATVAAKLEFYNPASSVKDRIGVSMIDAAEASGELEAGRHDRRGHQRQHRHRARDRRRGTRLPGRPHDARDDEQGAARPAARVRRRARAHAGQRGHEGRRRQGGGAGRGGGRRPRPAVRERGEPRDPPRGRRPRRSGTTPTAQVAAFVAGIGTGGTITGVGQVLKERNPDVKIIAVEPAASPILNGGAPGPHPIQGIGANFVPEILDHERLRRGHRRRGRRRGRLRPARGQGGGPAGRHLVRCRARGRRTRSRGGRSSTARSSWSSSRRSASATCRRSSSPT